MESHGDDSSSTADTAHFQPETNDEYDQEEASTTLEEKNSMILDDNMDAMRSNENAEVQRCFYPKREWKYSELFTINSLFRVHNDDELKMREALNCEENSYWNEAMSTEIKLKDTKCSEVIPKSSTTKPLRTKLLFNKNGTRKA